ncbi:MAG: S-layer homology domain-containing protein [Oscillospiraceae bacterium]|nr:S-layer homology domain-containing protein [Oscillospiraceae bacterium]
MLLSLAGCGGSSDANSTIEPETQILALSSGEITTGFHDVSADADYAEAVAWCRENGLLSGVGDNRFDPDGTLTRAMLATAIYRAAGEPAVSGTPSFNDTQSNTWYSNAVVWANANGIIQGYGNGLFGTDDPVSVEQLQVIIDRYLGRGNTWKGDPALKVPATRAQVAAALYENLKDTASSSGKVLVAYFSATGSTERVAEYIAEAMGADLFELEPVEPYTSSDLNYNNNSSRVIQEHDDPSLQDIALVKTTPDNWANYDVVFIGYPIWWHAASWVVNHFVTDNDFSGKTVIPFCTSASSPLEGSDEKLAAMTNTGNWLPGMRFSSGASQETVTEWVSTLKLTEPSTNTANVLVAYFSRTGENYGVGVIEKGNTEIVAEMIADGARADLFHIETVKTYPSGYEDTKTIAQQEQTENARPELTATVDSFDNYDVIFVGYPIWYSDAPMAVYTFLDSYNWNGKTVIPFCTHAGSGLSGTVSRIKTALPSATVLDGLSISGATAQNDRAATQRSVDTFLEGLDLSSPSSDISSVYMTTSISPEGLMEVYRALNWTPTGNVAVKLSTDV